MLILLSDAANDQWLEVIGMFGNSARNLRDRPGLHGGSKWMFRDEQVLIPVVPLDHIVPALTEVQLHIARRWSLNQGVCVVPGIGRGSLRCLPQLRREQVVVRIPAVVLA